MQLYDEDRVRRTAFKVLVARLAYPDDYVARTARRVGVSRQMVYRVVHRARALGAAVPDRGAGRTV